MKKKSRKEDREWEAIGNKGRSCNKGRNVRGRGRWRRAEKKKECKSEKRVLGGR